MQWPTELDFYRNKRVLITGNTGFKGSWLTKILTDAGAVVSGFSRCSEKEISLFSLAGVESKITQFKGDVRDYDALNTAFREAKPEIVFHLAAQPIVRKSYADPIETYETNVMGTVHLLECIRHSSSVKSVLNVTTDKVYLNREWEWGYRETDELDGYDPYSNSKSCSELVTNSYVKSFFQNSAVAISTARAGNVIGGGDFSQDRIIPDCVRAAMRHETIIVRNPHSIRPYQHVLEPLFAYLMIAAAQYGDINKAGCYNVGPDDRDCFRTGALVDLFARKWGDGIQWIEKDDCGPHESSFLKLDCSRLKSTFGWHPRWDLEDAMEKVVQWYKCWITGGDIPSCMEAQIKEYLTWEE